MSFVDALVGRLLDALENSAHADHTWIVLWSDHGWSLGEKEHWGKHVPWTESVRMPLIIVPPAAPIAGKARFRRGVRCAAPVSLLDLYPTLVDLCSLPPRPELEGNSLAPLLMNPRAPWPHAAVATIGRGSHSVFMDHWRYIRYFDGSEELYDTHRDPDEWFNIAGKPESVTTKTRLAQHIPEDPSHARYARWGRWKYVAIRSGPPLLFDIQAPFGISEQNDVAEAHPEVLESIAKVLSESSDASRRVHIPVR